MSLHGDNGVERTIFHERKRAMYKSKVFMVFILGAAITMTGFIGCSSKKKVVEEPKKEAVKPAPKKT